MVTLPTRPAPRLRLLILTILAVLTSGHARGRRGPRPAGAWRTVATVPATADMVDEVSFEPAAGVAGRLRIPATRFGGQNPKLAELAVRG